MSSYPIILDLTENLPPDTPTEPANLRAGDTATWQRNFAKYPASGGFSLAYTFLSQTATYQVSGGLIVATGDDFTVTIPAATTAGWAAGKYRWQAYISDGQGNRYTVAEGETFVLPNLQVQAAGFDDREQDEKDLDAVRAMLSGKLSAGDAAMYEIQGRKLQRYTFAELTKLRGQLERRVRAIRIRRGEVVPSRSIGVRFGNGF